MGEKYRVAGYVKLAKWCEQSKDSAVAYHHQYYESKFANDPKMQLIDVYIDITGNKEMRRRKEMLRLIGDCLIGKVNCIATQTRAYLAANNEEFFFLIHFLFSLSSPVEIMTEDDNYHIDTIRDADHQKEAMKKMAADFIQMNPNAYQTWEKNLLRAVKSRNQR